MGTSISWQYLIGDICFLIGATLWALYAIYLRHWQIKPEQAAIYIALCSSPYLLWYLFTRALPTTDMAMLLLQLTYQGAIVGMLAILFYGKTVTILGPHLGTLFSALPPVVVPIVAGLLLGYQSDFYEYLGIVMVFTGMIIAFIKPIQRFGWLGKS
jgi:drug/metabolite transporter (DMT)-like permease